MKLITTSMLLILGIASACSSDRPEAPKGWSTANKAADAEQATIKEESPLAIRADVGSNLRYADGHALTQIYQRIFPLRTYGFEQCRNDTFAYRSDCTATMFRPEERGFMGMIDLHSPNFGRGPQNIRRPEDMTLNYTRTLRVALGRECDYLVASEMKNLAEGKAASNILIKGDKPSKASIEEFFRKILGIEGSNMPVDVSADAYVAAFDTYLAGKNDNDTKQRAYFGLCVSVASDPQVFLY